MPLEETLEAGDFGQPGSQFPGIDTAAGSEDQQDSGYIYHSGNKDNPHHYESSHHQGPPRIQILILVPMLSLYSRGVSSG